MPAILLSPARGGAGDSQDEFENKCRVAAETWDRCGEPSLPVIDRAAASRLALRASAKNSRLPHFRFPVSSLRFLLSTPIARAASLAAALLVVPFTAHSQNYTASSNSSAGTITISSGNHTISVGSSGARTLSNAITLSGGTLQGGIMDNVATVSGLSGAGNSTTNVDANGVTIILRGSGTSATTANLTLASGVTITGANELLVGGGAGQDEAGMASGLFQGFQQGVGGDGVHPLGRVNQHHLAVGSSARGLGEAQQVAHGFHANLFAGFAFLVVNVFLRFFRQRPVQGQHVGFGHQHAQIGVGTDLDAMTAGADAASAR
jgi:hypothetical protein